MIFLKSAIEFQTVSPLMEPQNWDKIWPTLAVHAEDNDSGMFQLGIGWPMGLTRKAIVQKSTIEQSIRLDVIESESVGGWAELKPNESGDGWDFCVNIQVFGGASGAFLEELRDALEKGILRAASIENPLGKKTF